jgi:membrane-anchored protein YejM (alkaline phosphatase superfamily)
VYGCIFLKVTKMISPKCADYVTLSFKNRWRALMSVDDLIADVMQVVQDEGVADNTYFMYTSDHGFQVKNCDNCQHPKLLPTQC